ncbi:3-oxoacyl-(Acyl-carrier-protein) synthase ii [Brucella melitensis NI]|nr:3-oxoacyl-(Acyl-carrier-protein) synthase ii [Brucella melitensis NI]
MQNNKVVITGIGLISSLGEGVEAHWNAFSKAGTQPHLEKQAFAPYTVHPLGEVDWSLQIPKRGDQRQMENPGSGSAPMPPVSPCRMPA